MLKAEIGREQLSFASNNLSANFNACHRISIFSTFHSEVTSATHTPAQKGVRKGAPLFSRLAQVGKSLPGRCRISKEGEEGA